LRVESGEVRIEAARHIRFDIARHDRLLEKVAQRVLLRRQLLRIIEHLQNRSTQSIWSAFQNLQPPRHQQGFDRG